MIADVVPSAVAAVEAFDDPPYAIGIDAEVHETLPAGVLDRVSLPAERAAAVPATAPTPPAAELR